MYRELFKNVWKTSSGAATLPWCDLMRGNDATWGTVLVSCLFFVNDAEEDLEFELVIHPPCKHPERSMMHESHRMNVCNVRVNLGKKKDCAADYGDSYVTVVSLTSAEFRTKTGFLTCAWWISNLICLISIGDAFKWRLATGSLAVSWMVHIKIPAGLHIIISNPDYAAISDKDLTSCAIPSLSLENWEQLVLNVKIHLPFAESARAFQNVSEDKPVEWEGNHLCQFGGQFVDHLHKQAAKWQQIIHRR